MGEAEQNGRLSDAAGGRAAGRLAARPDLKRLARNTSGATAVEYGLIVSLIFLVILGAVTAFGTKSTGMYNSISTAISSAM
jgi:pilus assembly protein Flp/PilA